MIPSVFSNRLAGAPMTAALVGILGGCVVEPDQPQSQAERVITGLPEGWTGPAPDLLEVVPVVGWVNADEFGIVTIGSSSCPPVASAFKVETQQISGVPAAGNGDSGGPVYQPISPQGPFAAGVISGMRNATATCTGDPGSTAEKGQEVFSQPVLCSHR